ncbi:MAG: membrane protein insertase YidC [Azoarcus sp.]|jgi:YidC/Oxa1 family membrane protein insertase|nr:membrane protein insertase YidC [Azoarcus sp.]
MDQRRLILFIAFALSLVMLWTHWIEYNHPTPSAPATTSAAVPDQAAPAGTEAGDDSVPISTNEAAATPSESAPTAPQAARMTVSTDVMRAEISAVGGNLVRLELLEHKTNDPNNGVIIFDNGEYTSEAESGFTVGKSDSPLPTHQTLFTLPVQDQTLAAGQDKLVLRLAAPTVGDVTVTKVMTFTRGSYIVDVAYEIDNKSAAALTAQAYFQFLHDSKPRPVEQPQTGLLKYIHKFFSGFSSVRTFIGPAFYSEEGKFQKTPFEDIAEGKAKFVTNANDGWVAMVQHYFVSAWLPADGSGREYFTTKTRKGNFTAGMKLAPVTVEPGATATVETRLYAGPQDQNKLDGIAPGLRLVVDYGVLTVIAAPLFWLLSLLHKIFGNWGWAIIVVTIIIKAIFFPLSAASYKSMAKMRVLAPRMQRLKELYGDDKARMQQEMMNLYRKEKINPLGGCLPILVQIPVFIALYWVLLGSAEMRQAPWLGWIQDLSAPDPYLILPLIMGASMLIQQKLNPAPPDPMQARIMMALPIIFTVMFLFFPSGLVLYWVVNNLLSIAQQWQITRLIERGGNKSAKAANDPKA